MQLLVLPSISRPVFPLCFGCHRLGLLPSADESVAMLDDYEEEGGNFFDTAAGYSDWVPGEKRRSERLLGEWLASRGLTDKVVVATKGAHHDLDDGESRVTPSCIAEDIDTSRESLGVPSIDLYYLHRDNPSAPVEPLIDVLNEAVRAGKICSLGASNWTADRIRSANAYAERSGQQGFIANQMQWNLATEHLPPREDKGLVKMDDATLRLHQETGMIAIPYNAQAGGFFSKWLAANEEQREALAQRPLATIPNLQRAEAVRRLAEAKRWSVNAVILGWLRAPRGFPVVPIFSCSSREQLADTMEAARAVLNQSEAAYLEAGIAEGGEP